MTFIVIDGFDHAGSAATTMGRLADKSSDGASGWNGTELTDTDLTPVTGRDGEGLAMRFATSESTATLEYDLETDLADTPATNHLIGGVAFKLGFDPALATANIPVIGFRDSGGTTEAGLSISAGGNIWALRDSFGTGLPRGSDLPGRSPRGSNMPVRNYAQPIVREGVWHYAAWDYKISRSSGSLSFNGYWRVWLDGMLVAEEYDYSTWFTGNDLASVYFYKNHTLGTMDWDDFWLASQASVSDWSTGSAAARRDGGQNNNPAPDTGFVAKICCPRVRTRFPDADGTTTNWTPDTGTVNYTQVDDNPDDGDTTYVESSTANHIDLYEFPAQEADVRNVLMTQVCATVKETATPGGSEEIAMRSRHSTNERSYGAEDAQNTAYEVKRARVRRNNGSTPADLPITLTNAAAESGDLTGWAANATTPFMNYLGPSDSSSAFASADTTPLTPQAGTYYFAFDNDASLAGGFGTLYFLEQITTLSDDSVPEADIDAGILQAEFTGYAYETGTDHPQMRLVFYDSQDVVIKWTTQAEQNPGAVWTQTTFTAHIPPGTRKIGWCMGGGNETNPSTLDVFWDTMSAAVAYITDDDEFTVTEINAAEFGVELTVP